MSVRAVKVICDACGKIEMVEHASFVESCPDHLEGWYKMQWGGASAQDFCSFECLAKDLRKNLAHSLTPRFHAYLGLRDE